MSYRMALLYYLAWLYKNTKSAFYQEFDPRWKTQEENPTTLLSNQAVADLRNVAVYGVSQARWMFEVLDVI